MSKLEGRADFGVTITSGVQAGGALYIFPLENVLYLHTLGLDPSGFGPYEA